MQLPETTPSLSKPYANEACPPAPKEMEQSESGGWAAFPNVPMGGESFTQRILCGHHHF